MDKEILKKPWVLVGLLFAVTLITGLVSLSLSVLFKIRIPSALPAVLSILGAGVIGQRYAISFKEVMPSGLRKKVALIFVIIQSVLIVPYVFLIDYSFESDISIGLDMALIGLALAFIILCGLLIYFEMGRWGRAYLKAINKQK